MNKYQLTLESWDGDCKRITVIAASPEDAMGAYMFGQWVAVDCKRL